MPVKKCKYCKTRMNKVLWGMPTEDDYERADEFTEFRGCIIMGPVENWRCGHCGAKVIPGFTPTSGFCTQETPVQLSRALHIFTKRLSSLSDLEYEVSNDNSRPDISVNCGGPSLEHALDSDPEHDSRGDWLEILVCNQLALKIFFNGTGQLVNNSYKNSDSVEDVARYEQEFEFPASANLPKDLDDLIVGSHLLLAIMNSVVTYRNACTMEGCDHESENPWEAMEEHYPELSGPNARLSPEFPIIR